jgi:hypothetical protein
VKKPVLIKLVIGLMAIAAFGFLFMRSLRDSRSEPYTVDQQHLRGWVLALEPASMPNEPLLVLRPAAALPQDLFRQVFARTMESYTALAGSAMPIVLRGEYDKVVGDQMTQDQLLAAARAAGLEQASMVPRCLVHRRTSVPGGVRQVYLALFDAPAVTRFRQQLGLDAGGQSPILFIAGADADFGRWLPMRVDAAAECLAAIDVAD